LATGDSVEGGSLAPALEAAAMAAAETQVVLEVARDVGLLSLLSVARPFQRGSRRS